LTVAVEPTRSETSCDFTISPPGSRMTTSYVPVGNERNWKRPFLPTLISRE